MDCRYFHIDPAIDFPHNHRHTSYLLSLIDGNDWLLKSSMIEGEGEYKQEGYVSQKSLDGVIQAAQEQEWGRYLNGKLSDAHENDNLINT